MSPVPYEPTSAHAKRARLREDLAGDGLVRLPGAFNALSAMAIERAGFEGVYLSGAVVAASLGLPDIGLTTASEVTERAAEIARMTTLPLLVDADTGFGPPLSVARTVQGLEDAGAAGCHIEDQTDPKRCGHLDGKSVVALPDAVRRVAAAVGARRDPSFLIVARTDIRALEGLDACIERSKALAGAGADVIFPEALATRAEFAQVAEALDVPVLANMTEFGKSPLLTAPELTSAGVRMVIYPVTLLRLAMKSVTGALETLAGVGSQQSLVGAMQTRTELYDLLGYSQYDRVDRDLAAAWSGDGEREGNTT